MREDDSLHWEVFVKQVDVEPGVNSELWLSGGSTEEDDRRGNRRLRDTETGMTLMERRVTGQLADTPTRGLDKSRMSPVVAVVLSR